MGDIKARNSLYIWFTAKMTGLYKLFVFFCAVSLVFGFMSVRDDANWFKNGQNIKNRFVTGVVNGVTDFDCNDVVNGENVEGECMSKLECTKSGGKVGGLCSLLGSCCVLERTCSQTTSSKVSYFIPPTKFQTKCALTVNIYSKNVCQLRLDFEKFDIAKPTKNKIKIDETHNGYSSYQCQDDQFTVDAGKVNLGIPHLCGKNKGQHIYIPVVENQQKVVLTFNLKDRETPNVNLGSADWRIKIRQLECRKSGYEHILTAPSKLMTMYNNLKNKKQTKSDWELIAPPNCLQYFPNETGTFESFNYNEGKGNYIGRSDYAICLKKTGRYCGARYTAKGVFKMNSNKEEENKNTNRKCHPNEKASYTVSQDYIRITEGVCGDRISDYYCNQDLNNNTVVAKSYEPLYVGVHTDSFMAVEDTSKENDTDVVEVGFRIGYQLYSDNCDILS